MVDRAKKDTKTTKDRSHSAVSKYLPDDIRLQHEQRIYRAEDFYVAVCDANGHDMKIGGIRAHPMMVNAINMLIARGNLPINTPHDFARIAMFEFLIVCSELERGVGVPNYTARLSAINRIQLQSRHNREFEDSLVAAETEADTLIAKGKLKMAAMFIHDVLVEAKQIPQMTWRDHYVERLMAKYGKLLKSQGESVTLKRKESS